MKQLRDSSEVVKQYNVRKKLVIAVSKADKKKHSLLHKSLFRGADVQTGEQPHSMFLKLPPPPQRGAFMGSNCTTSGTIILLQKKLAGGPGSGMPKGLADAYKKLSEIQKERKLLKEARGIRQARNSEKSEEAAAKAREGKEGGSKEDPYASSSSNREDSVCSKKDDDANYESNEDLGEEEAEQHRED